MRTTVFRFEIRRVDEDVLQSIREELDAIPHVERFESEHRYWRTELRIHVTFSTSDDANKLHRRS